MKITSSEFQSHIGKYLEISEEQPVLITKHGRPARVLLDTGLYECLMSDTRGESIDPEVLAAIEYLFFDLSSKEEDGVLENDPELREMKQQKFDSAFEKAFLYFHLGGLVSSIKGNEEYRRLTSGDDRKALYPHELDSEIKADIEKEYQGEPTPDIDHLME